MGGPNPIYLFIYLLWISYIDVVQQKEKYKGKKKKSGIVNETTKSDFTPLHIAAHYGNVNVAALLIEKDANVNFKAVVY